MVPTAATGDLPKILINPRRMEALSIREMRPASQNSVAQGRGANAADAHRQLAAGDGWRPLHGRVLGFTLGLLLAADFGC